MSQTAEPSQSPTPDTPDLTPPLTVHVEVTGTPQTPAQTPALTLAPTPSDGAESVSDGDTGLVLTATVPAPGSPLARLTLDTETASALSLAPDNTGAALSPDGDLVLGLAAPVVVDATGATLRASWQEPTPDPGTDGLLAVDLVLDTRAAADAAAATSAYPLTVTVHLGTTTVTATEWGVREGGDSLAVTPSAWGRVSGQTGYALGWADVVRLEPTADTSVMEKQFRCHQLGAPDKATWNLEPWRPDVSYLAYVAARCNPTG